MGSSVELRLFCGDWGGGSRKCEALREGAPRTTWKSSSYLLHQDLVFSAGALISSHLISSHMPSSAVTVLPDSRHVYAKPTGNCELIPRQPDCSGSRPGYGNGNGSNAAHLSPTHVSYTDTSCTAAETGTQTPAIVRLISCEAYSRDVVFGRVSSESPNQKNAPRARICLVDSRGVIISP